MLLVEEPEAAGGACLPWAAVGLQNSARRGWEISRTRNGEEAGSLSSL